jgi:mono/diheme cytochrome c family protein/glucose/arabinose dehydrogenase
MIRKTMLLTLALLASTAIAERKNVNPDPPATTFPPGESMAMTEVPKGFHLELVASEPMIEDPVCMAWGPDGELYVAQMRSYMLDVDATDELTPISQVIRLEDTDGDGKMDKRTVYLDNLTLPRAILTLDNKVLIGEPPNLWLCEDTDGDGVADKKESIYDRFAKKDSGNVEHKINGLQWTLDNWIYNAKTPVRFRYKNGKLQEENLIFMGQWGHTTNDRGERFMTTNSNSAISNFVRSKYLARHPIAKRNESLFNRIRKGEGYGTTWPIQGTPDTQGGPGLSRKDDKSLQRFTAACGQTIFRGDRLGDELKGSYWVPEPVGRMIRCATVSYQDGMVTLDNYLEEQKSEFIASRDANFRPVNAYTGPDGTLYFIDMYRGIIQHGNWTREGSYLRGEILRRGLDKNVGGGRIYRLVKDDLKPGPLPKFGKASTKELVAALRHPNGWWRDEAQKLLVLRADPAAAKLLEAEALSGPAPLGRVHAVWALEGLGKWTTSLAAKVATDANQDVRLAALQASDGLMPTADAAMQQLVATPLSDDGIGVAIQRLSSLSLNQFDPKQKAPKARPGQVDRVLRIVAAHPGKDVVIKTALVALNPAEYVPALNAIGGDKGGNLAAGKLPGYLSFAVLKSEDPKAINELIDVAAAASPEFRDVILKGLRSGPASRTSGALIRYKEEPPGIVKLKAAKVPAHVLSPLTAVMTWPGEAKYNLKRALKPLNAKQQKLFDQGRDVYKTLCATCHGANGEGMPMPDNSGVNLAPPLAGSPRVTFNKNRYVTKILLKGMTGPIDGITYGGTMAPMEANTDEWLAAVLTFIRRSWDNGADPVEPADVKRVRGWHKNMTAPFTEETLNFPKPKQKKKQ